MKPNLKGKSIDSNNNIDVVINNEEYNEEYQKSQNQNAFLMDDLMTGKKYNISNSIDSTNKFSPKKRIKYSLESIQLLKNRAIDTFELKNGSKSIKACQTISKGEQSNESAYKQPNKKNQINESKNDYDHEIGI